MAQRLGSNEDVRQHSAPSAVKMITMSQHVTRGAHPARAAPRNSLLGMCPFTSAQVPKSSWQLVAFFQPTDSLGRAQRCCRDSSAQRLYRKIILKQKDLTWRARSSFCAHMWCSYGTSGICRQVSDSKMSLLDYLFNPQNNLKTIYFILRIISGGKNQGGSPLFQSSLKQILGPSAQDTLVIMLNGDEAEQCLPSPGAQGSERHPAPSGLRSAGTVSPCAPGSASHKSDTG